MKYFKTYYSIFYVFIISFLFITLQAFSSIPLQDDIKYFEKGLEAKANGNLEEALSIWQRSYKESLEPDFRIAQSYIDLVTDYELKQYYREASEIYIWGLKGNISSREKKFLFKELDYIHPIIDDRDYKNFKREVDNNNSDVFTSIKKIWNELDPTPTTPYNERLLEHWERVQVAKTKYKRKNSDELDDRGLIYIKFGEPFYNRKGQLNYLASTVSRLVKEGIDTPSFATSDQLAINTTQRLNMENRIRGYHNFPRYEVWIYKQLTKDTQNIIYIFGTRDATSSFRKIQSVEDFIPNAAYRTSGQNNYSLTRGVTSLQNQGGDDRENARVNTLRSANLKTPKVDFSPALILQLMYYQQFAAMDKYFGNSYNEMMNRYVSRANTSRKGLAREFETLYGSKLLFIQNSSPNEISTYKSKIMEIPDKNFSYRFLDEDNNPYLKVFSIINLEKAAYYNLLKETNSIQSNHDDRYILISGYQVRNELGDKLYEVKKEKKLQSFANSLEVVDISYQSNSTLALISHELHKINEYGNEQISDESPYPKSLKGSSSVKLKLPDPLNTNNLMLSDLIIGYTYPDEPYPSSAFSNEDSLNFVITHDGVIPKGSELNLYFELYKLKPADKDGIAEYSFEYAIKKVKKGFLGLGKSTDNQQNSITIYNSVANTRDNSAITINTSEYKKGNYKLFIKIKDINSGSTYSKIQSFSIK